MRAVTLIVGLGVLALSAGVASAQLGNTEQKCVNKINKSASKVHAAQGTLNSSCI